MVSDTQARTATDPTPRIVAKNASNELSQTCDCKPISALRYGLAAQRVAATIPMICTTNTSAEWPMPSARNQSLASQPERCHMQNAATAPTPQYTYSRVPSNPVSVLLSTSDPVPLAVSLTRVCPMPKSRKVSAAINEAKKPIAPYASIPK